MTDKQLQQLITESKKVRRTILETIHRAQASHIASAFSATDLLLYLHAKVLRKNKDRFILSKGWAASALYAVLAHRGHFSVKDLITRYCTDGSPFIGITTRSGLPGIETTTGSMGHGLPVGVGMAIAARKKRTSGRVFVMISDGELDEGSTWEAIFFSGHHRLDNLVVIIDANKFQAFGTTKDILDFEPIEAKFQASRWSAKRINGHDFKQMEKAFSRIPFERGRPNLIIADTVKGKGVSFMEHKNDWHYRTPDKEQFAAALKELT